jgi:hypothetical protein
MTGCDGQSACVATCSRKEYACLVLYKNACESAEQPLNGRPVGRYSIFDFRFWIFDC